jgi:hypothetical protein
MNADARKEWIKEAITIARAVADMEERLAVIKATLVMEALKDENKGVATKGGGQSVTFAGEECVARVVFPGPSLAASVKNTDADFPKIVKAAGAHFRALFRPQTTCKPVADFRELAQQLLGDKAPALIELLEKESKPTVSFEVTESFDKGWPE